MFYALCLHCHHLVVLQPQERAHAAAETFTTPQQSFNTSFLDPTMSHFLDRLTHFTLPKRSPSRATTA